MKNTSPKSNLYLSRVSKLKYKLPILYRTVSLLSSTRSFFNKSYAMQITNPYCNIRITTDDPMSVNSPPEVQTTVSAAKLNPMNEAQKYRIRKFQNIVFFIFMKKPWTFGILRETKIDAPITSKRTRIPIAESATPSRLQKTELFVMASRFRVEAICFLSSEDRLMIPEMALITISTLAGGNMLLRRTRRITICKAQQQSHMDVITFLATIYMTKVITITVKPTCQTEVDIDAKNTAVVFEGNYGGILKMSVFELSFWKRYSDLALSTNISVCTNLTSNLS